MADDAVTIAPDLYKVLFENDRVRVLENRMKPGERSAMHSHPGLVFYTLTSGKFKFTFPDGETMDLDLEPGQAGWMDPVTHSTESVGPAEGRVLIIEMK